MNPPQGPFHGYGPHHHGGHPHPHPGYGHGHPGAPYPGPPRPPKGSNALACFQMRIVMGPNFSSTTQWVPGALPGFTIAGGRYETAAARGR